MLAILVGGLVLMENAHPADGDDLWATEYFRSDVANTNPWIPPSAILTLHQSQDRGLLAGGAFNGLGGVGETAGLAALHGEGWTGLGGGFMGTVYCMSVTATEIIIGGSFTSAGGVAATNIAKWDGLAWSPIGEGLHGGSVRSLAWRGQELYAGGTFISSGEAAVLFLAKWDGNTWSEVGGGVDGATQSESRPPVSAITVAGELVYVGGSFSSVGGVPVANIACWNGTNWSSVGSSPNNGLGGPVSAMVSTSAGRLFCGGDFLAAGGQPANRVALWDGNTWSNVGLGLTTNLSEAVRAMFIWREELFVGGHFSSAGGRPISGLAKWDGEDWRAVGAPLSRPITAIAGDENTLFVSGVLVNVAAAQANGLVAYDSRQWSVIGGGVGGDSSELRVLRTTSKGLVAGGLFSGQLFTPDYIAEWDGTNWNRLGTGLRGAFSDPITGANAPTAAAIAVSGGDSYVCGSFTNAGGVSARNVAVWSGGQWGAMAEGLPTSGLAIIVRGAEVFVGHQGGIQWSDGSNWGQLGHGLDGAVRALATRGYDLFAGGDFNRSADTELNHIARWDGTNWLSLGSGLNGPVRAIIAHGDRLYVGGAFTVAGGMSANHVAMWDGTNWYAVGEGFNTGITNSYRSWITNNALTTVSDLAMTAQGSLFAVGNFLNAANTQVRFVAKYSNNAWTALGTGLDQPAAALLLDADELYVGGAFTTAGFRPSLRIARWQIADEILTVRQTGPTVVSAGSQVTYTFTVKHIGQTVSRDTVINNLIPDGAQYVSSTQGGLLQGKAVIWSLGDLASGESQSVSLTLSLDPATRLLSSESCIVTNAEGVVARANSAATSVIGNNAPPTISAQPQNGSVFLPLSNVLLSFDARDLDGPIRQIDVYSGTQLMATTLSNAVSITLTNLRAGEYPFKGVASDFMGGMTATNLTITVVKPPNDDFVARTFVSGTSIDVEGVIADATAEAGEPNHQRFFTVNSIWWAWDAPSAPGRVTITTDGSDCRHVVAVYTGSSLTNLMLVASDKGSLGPTTSQLSFDAAPSVQYQIAVDGGYPYSVGHIQLHLRFNYAPEVRITSPSAGSAYAGPATVPVTIAADDPDGPEPSVLLFVDPFEHDMTTACGSSMVSGQVFIAGGSFTLAARAIDAGGVPMWSEPANLSVSLCNDFFSNRIQLAPFDFTTYGTMIGATVESFEPTYPLPNEGYPRHSVWWKWMAPSTGLFSIDASTYGVFHFALEVYARTNLSELVPVAWEVGNFFSCEATFKAEQDTDYCIAVSAMHTGEGNYRLRGRFVEPVASVITISGSTTQGLLAHVRGSLARTVILLGSTNAINWVPSCTNVLICPELEIPLSIPSEQTWGFYRVLTVP